MFINKSQKQNSSQKGYLLIEIIISLAILSFALPSITTSYLTMQKNISTIYQKIVQKNELTYFYNFLHTDLRKSKKIHQTGSNYLEFQNMQNETIIYLLKNHKIGRKKKSTFYLTEKLSVQSFSSSHISTQNLELKIKFTNQEKTYVFYLPNEK